jgi:hypothetical protein
MGAEALALHLKMPTTETCPEPLKCSSQFQAFFNNHFNIILTILKITSLGFQCLRTAGRLCSKLEAAMRQQEVT